MRVLFLDCDGVLNSRDDYMVSGDQKPYYILNHKKVDLYDLKEYFGGDEDE